RIEGEGNLGARLLQLDLLPPFGDLAAPVVHDPPIHIRGDRARWIDDPELRLLRLPFVEDAAGLGADQARLGTGGGTIVADAAVLELHRVDPDLGESVLLAAGGHG